MECQLTAVGKSLEPIINVLTPCAQRKSSPIGTQTRAMTSINNKITRNTGV
ncbi:hypothetical protein LZD49_06810 [Dyadobacter sp. CY261]|uniref:hypothetical protein n=1 Tax=Dyadobacter sp. CY261 TaxID=2907203 RepID=UPI001F3BB804|nr:hypothetical protein [Dyadobacter sp. CY261]MCF0070175.1 hypothetical protein [Dyadobacter sp. CY261]